MTKTVLAGVAAKVLLAFAAMALTLLLAEVAVRIVASATGRIPLFITHDQAGWGLRPNLRNAITVFSKNKFVTSTDQDGHRLCYPIGKSPPTGAPMLVLVGDSFVQGIGVNDDQNLAWNLARQTDYDVVNLGVAGYGTDQELVKLERFLSTHPGAVIKHIIVLVFDNDFVEVQSGNSRYLGRSKPQFYLSGKELVRPHYAPHAADRLMDVSRLFWLLNSKRTWFFSRPDPPAEDGIDLVVACLEAMQRRAESREAHFHAFAYQRLMEPLPLTSLQWKRFIQNSGATDITEHVNTAQGPNPIGPDGGHWSVAGNALVTTILLEYLKADTAGEQKTSKERTHLTDTKANRVPDRP